MEAQMAARKKAMAENGAKAASATKAVLDGVKGTYKAVIDEATIPAQAKAQPGFAQKLAALKADPPSITVANDGSVTLKKFDPGDVSGFTSNVDGKPAVVVNVPKPQPGGPSKQFLPLKVSDGGAMLELPFGKFKRA
jgi:hypothetical protein